VLIWLLTIAALWTILCALSHSAPDLDGMEELVWAVSLEWGYTKHPPLPTWFMHLAIQGLGASVWLPFLMGQIFSALGLWFVWKLGCELTTPHRALMATLLVSVTAYFSLRGTIYNHNTAQLWAITASIWLFYRATHRQRWRDWAWLGLVAGLAMLTKYSALIQFAAFFLYLLASGLWRQARIWRGIGLATLIFLVVLSPHGLWLVRHHFEPLFYAETSLQAASRLQALLSLWDFLLDQLGRLSPMLVLGGLWTVWYRRRADHGPGQAANEPLFQRLDTATGAPLRPASYWAQLDADARRFLLWTGLAPVASTLLLSLALGSKLEASWGSTFFVLAGFYGLAWMRGLDSVQLRRLLILTAAVQILMAVSYALARGPIAQAVGHASRSTYPGPALAAHAVAHWQAHQPGRPLRVVVANTWLGGNIALHTGQDTRVYIDASDAESPWFAPGTALACGALVAWSDDGRGRPSAEVRRLYDAAPWKGRDEIPWSGPRGRRIDLNWAVLPATKDCLKP